MHTLPAPWALPSIDELKSLRLEVRRGAFGRDERYWGGGCHIVSRAVTVWFGFPARAGCYRLVGGRHMGHCWNALPDGRILDVTTDQFEDGNDIRLTNGDDSRYVRDCPCEYAFVPEG